MGKASASWPGDLAFKPDDVALGRELIDEIDGVRGEIEPLEANLTAMVTAQNSLLRADMIEWIRTAHAFNFIGTAGFIGSWQKPLADEPRIGVSPSSSERERLLLLEA